MKCLLISLEKHPCEKELRGISRNKTCIVCATNKKQILILDANCSKFTFEDCKNTYCRHIKNGSTIFANEEKTHKKIKDEIDVMTCIFNSEIFNDFFNNRSIIILGL